MQTRLHLVRHAEVHNPDNIWYGRLEGFYLSERGLRQAEALGAHFKDVPLTAVYCSPMERAKQTAAAIAHPHGLDTLTEELIIESETKLQGKPGDRRMFINPLRARHFFNPWRPSWGESYASIEARMRDALDKWLKNHPGEEVVGVSHMTPIGLIRQRMQEDRRPPWITGIPTRHGSVTTFVYEEDRLESVEYTDVGYLVS